MEHELRSIIENDDMFDKFKNFDDNQVLFSRPKEEYIIPLSEMILEQLVQRKINNSMIFHKFVISILTPIIKEDFTHVFKNKLLLQMISNQSTYDAFIRGICGSKSELIAVVKNDIIDKLENGLIDIDYFYNFVISTIDDISVFNQEKDVDNLATDYIVYFKIINLIANNHPEKIDALIKVLCYHELRKSELFGVVKIADLNDKNNGEHSFYNGIHQIKINKNLITSYQKGDKKALAKIIAVTYHEAQHAVQYNLYYNSTRENYKVLLWAKEELARIAIGIRYYDENYKSYIYESDANYVGWKNTKKYFNEQLEDFTLDEFFLNNMKVYKEKRKNSYHKDIENILGHGVIDHRASLLLNAITLNYVKNNPLILKEFPILSVEFKTDGTPKSILEKMSDREKCKLSILDSRKETYSHYLNGVITKDELFLKEQEYTSLLFDANRLYDFVLSEFIDSHLDKLIEEGFKITMSKEDVSTILINIIKYIFENFYNEDLDSRVDKIAELLKISGDYISIRRQELDKFYYLKLLSHREWVDKTRELASKHYYIMSKFKLIKDGDLNEQNNKRNKHVF